MIGEVLEEVIEVAFELVLVTISLMVSTQVFRVKGEASPLPYSRGNGEEQVDHYDLSKNLVVHDSKLLEERSPVFLEVVVVDNVSVYPNYIH